MRATIALRVAPAIGATHLSTADGDPIWPYSDADTLAALTNLAELFDSTVVEATPAKTKKKRKKKGLVVSARSETDDVASLYAHLTNRNFEPVRDAAILEMPRPDMVVAPPEVLTADFLEQLYSDLDRAPGLIAAPSQKAMLRQALLRSAALCLSKNAREPGKRVDVRPLSDFGHIDRGDWEVLGPGAGPIELKRALESGSTLLTIMSAGDGIDAQLGSLIMCPMDHMPASSRGPAPPCAVNGFCHRIQLPIAETLKSGRVVSPDVVAARVLVLHACWGLQPGGALNDPEWGYGYRLAHLDRLGAMLTTWQITIGSAAETETLAQDLARGRSLGESLARFNRSAPARRTGQRMCLFGDPELRIHAARPHAVIQRPPRADRAAQNENSQLAFLSAYLSTMPVRPEYRELHAVAVQATTACQQLMWSGMEIDAPGESAGATMRKVVLEFLSTNSTHRSVNGVPAYHWMDLAAEMKAKDLDSRCLCGQPDREVSFRLRIPGAGSREIQLCIRCGMTEDRPAKSRRVRITIKKSTASLHIDPPQGGWAAMVLIRPYVGELVVRPWPADKDGQPKPSMRIFDQAEAPSPGQLVLFMMDGTTLWVARTLYGLVPGWIRRP